MLVQVGQRLKLACGSDHDFPSKQIPDHGREPCSPDDSGNVASNRIKSDNRLDGKDMHFRAKDTHVNPRESRRREQVHIHRVSGLTYPLFPQSAELAR